MTLERRDVLRGLRKKGFAKDNGANHIVLHHTVDGRDTGVVVTVSRGSKYKTLGHPFVKGMAAQSLLSTKQFRKLVSCELSQEDYARIALAGKSSSEADKTN